MRILYNATFVRVGGGLSYVSQQIAALAAEPDVELTVLAAPWNHDALAPLADHEAGIDVRLVKVPNVPARFVWEQVGLPVAARRHDALLCPGNFGAMFSPVPQIVILQNANYVGRGRTLPQNAGAGRRAKIWQSHLSMKRADLVVSISESLSGEIRSESALAGLNLVTIQSGAPEAAPAGTAPDPAISEAVTRLVGHEPYLLSVANDYPHKRLSDLARLVTVLAESHACGPRRVVFAGAVTEERRGQLRAQAGDHAADLVFLGSVADRATILELYRRAAASVSTSELEAWPLTLHEARSQGSALVVADIPAHRELVDGQAQFFPVGDAEALAKALDALADAPAPPPWSLDRTWAQHGQELAAAVRQLVG